MCLSNTCEKSVKENHSANKKLITELFLRFERGTHNRTKFLFVLLVLFAVFRLSDSSSKFDANLNSTR